MKKVLIVDDERSVVGLLEKRLQESGYAVESAADGLRGLEMIRAVRPNVAILDVMMPGMDGFSLVREIRADKNLRDIPLIILTAKSDLGDLFKMEGVQAFITKPFSTEEVLDKVKTLTRD